MANGRFHSVSITEKKYPIREAAPILGKAEKTLRTWIADGKIGVLRIGRNIYLPESELQRVLDESFVPAQDAA